MEVKRVYNRDFGKLGEEAAADYIIKNGYKLLEKNYRMGKMGEIDIIAVECEFICFIEVKTRTNNFFGEPSESVGNKKQCRMRKLAWAYLKQHKLSERCIRFDIVEVTGKKNGMVLLPEKINLIRNAF